MIVTQPQTCKEIRVAWPIEKYRKKASGKTAIGEKLD